ncbi:MAG: hypothetical protein WA061_04840 [Microgenomates group bacterium]
MSTEREGINTLFGPGFAAIAFVLTYVQKNYTSTHNTAFGVMSEKLLKAFGVNKNS